MMKSFAFMPANLGKLLQNYIKDVLLSHQPKLLPMRKMTLLLALMALSIGLLAQTTATCDFNDYTEKVIIE